MSDCNSGIPQNETADLLSQLEEEKFLRLFRYLLDVPRGVHDASTPRPVIANDAQVQAVAVPGERFHDAMNWFFQLAHLPAFLCSPDNVEPFVRNSLTSAFTALRKRPDLLDSLLRKTLSGPVAQNGWPQEWCKINSDYYFLTNLPKTDLFSDDGAAYTEMAHQLFCEITGVSRPQHPVFGFADVETFTSLAFSEVRRFIIDLLNSPSGYYLIARDGQVSNLPAH